MNVLKCTNCGAPASGRLCSYCIGTEKSILSSKTISSFDKDYVSSKFVNNSSYNLRELDGLMYSAYKSEKESCTCVISYNVACPVHGYFK